MNTYIQNPFQRVSNPSLPQPKCFSFENQQNNELTVPNQLPLNFSIRPDCNSKIRAGEWGSRMLENPFERRESFWRDEDIYSLHSYGEMTKKDVEYQRIKNAEDEKLKKNLSDFQKALLRQFGVVHGSHFVDC